MGDVDEDPRYDGQPGKGNTYRAAERIRELMESHRPAEFEYLWLRDTNLLPCRGASSASRRGMQVAVDAVLASDILILGTPIR